MVHTSLGIRHLKTKFFYQKKHNHRMHEIHFSQFFVSPVFLFQEHLRETISKTLRAITESTGMLDRRYLLKAKLLIRLRDDDNTATVMFFDHYNGLS